MLHVSERKDSDFAFKLKTYSALAIPLPRTSYFIEELSRILNSGHAIEVDLV